MIRGGKYKTGLLCGILLFLFVPLLQNVFHFKSVKPLKGAYIDATDTELSSENWFKGDYQRKKDAYLDQNFGFRNYYVRLDNQIDFTLFSKANAAKVIVGKGNFLYEDDYINAYYGNNFIGKKNLEERFKKLKTVQLLLRSKGITLEVVFAPGKASFYPEFIPENWKTEKKPSNYEYAKELCDNLGMNYVDLNAWFLKLKSISPYDLYPKTGIHWSNYGSLIAMDTIKKHIEKSAGIDMRDFAIDNVGFSDSLLDPDNDIGGAMNLLFDIKTLPMPYANYHWLENVNDTKPTALFIGDSYFWNLYYQGLINNFFTDSKFWYYNETVYPENEPERSVKRLDLRSELKKYKVIVLLATECNIQDIGWGFVDNINELFKNEMQDAFRRSVYMKSIIDEIKGTPQWMTDIKRKASENNISIEEQIKLDAEYIYSTDYGRTEVVKITEDNKVRIKNTPEWIEQIKTKAKEKSISFEEMLELDAKYIYVTEQRATLKK